MDYPPAPWLMHGRAFVQPFVVDAKTVHLPAGFSAVTIAGRAIGVLSLIEYLPPSPLVYAELVWMPCLVRAAGKRGHFVARMYVDSDASLAGGRAIWALPKQKARFTIGEREATVEAEDGAHLVLSLERRGPAIKAAAGAGTLQAAPDGVVRFRGSGTARISSGSLRVREARGLEAWTGWAGAHRMPALGMALEDFAITMHEPLRLDARA